MNNEQLSRELLIGIFRAVYGDLQGFGMLDNHEDDEDDDEDDDYAIMLNQAIANSIETMPEFSFATRNDKIVLNVSTRTVTTEDAVAAGICSVCFDGYTTGSTVTDLPCLHSYHSECIASWAVQVPKCPVCRQDIPTN